MSTSAVPTPSPRVPKTAAPRPQPMDPFWTVPNVLTLSRLAIAGAMWAVRPKPKNLIGLLAVGALTDVLDGWAARKRRARHGTRQGAGVWLDPLCDKVFVLSAAGVAHVRCGAAPHHLALVASRELVLLPLLLVDRITASNEVRDFHAAPIGKVATSAQLLALASLMARRPSAGFLSLVAAGCGAAAAWYYGRRTLQERRVRRLLAGDTTTAAPLS